MEPRVARSQMAELLADWPAPCCPIRCGVRYWCRTCDRSVESDRPTHPAQGSNRLATSAGVWFLLSVGTEPTVDLVRLERRLSIGGFGPQSPDWRDIEEDSMPNDNAEVIR